ncbi:MAG: GWxTD domain-containing protein [candidate division KSB1 bacterium]|nr:GWxTD domain-containing protein [candidate division KSB1 bacterium]
MKTIRLVSLMGVGLLSIFTSINLGSSPKDSLTVEDKTPSFNFEGSFARFKGPEDLVYLEFYLAVPRNQLTFVKDKEGFKGGFGLLVQILKQDSLVAERAWNNINRADSLSEIKENQQLFATTSFNLPAGEYKCKVRMSDLHSDKTAEKEALISLVPFSNDQLCLSDIELASSIVKDTVKSQYYKNSYKVIPNPTGLYGPELPILYCYTEIYNLTKNIETDTSKYLVTYRILEGHGEEVRAFPPQVKRKPGTSAVEVGGINIVTLHSGTYLLLLEVYDRGSGQTVTAQKKFFVYRKADLLVTEQPQPTPQPSTLSIYDDTRYDTMTEKEIDEEFETLKYISSNDEKRTYKKLDLAGKRNFMREFWAKKDDTPNTKRNEFRDNYLSRVKYANDHFSGFKKGWQSDPGRVLLIYGQPDEIERSPFSGDVKPYQIWRYFSIQGGIEFIFVDKKGMGDLELVHSTARGELHDPDWERWLEAGR